MGKKEENQKPEFQEEIGSSMDLDENSGVNNSINPDNDSSSAGEGFSKISEKFRSGVNKILPSRDKSGVSVDDTDSRDFKQQDKLNDSKVENEYHGEEEDNGEESDRKEIQVVDEVSEIYQDMEIMRESLENKVDKEVELLEEDVDEAFEDSNDRMDELEDELNSKIEETEKRLNREISYIQEEISSINSEIEKIVEAVNSKVDKSRYENDVKKEVHEIEEEVEEKADNSKVEDMQEIQNIITQELEDKMDEYDLESDGEDLKKNLGMLEKEVEKLAVGESSDPKAPSEISDKLIGEFIEVKGNLSFKKAIDKDYLYILEGEKDSIAVKSESKLDEESNMVKGVVKNVDGFLFVQSVQP